MGEEREGRAGLVTVVAAAAVFGFLVVCILIRALVLKARDRLRTGRSSTEG
jgi:hypothetical protein